MSSSRLAKSYERSTTGLRDALFDEMEDLRVGASHPQEALAFSRLAEQVIASADLDLRREATEDRRAERQLREQELLERQRMLLLSAPEDDDDNESRG